MTSSFTINCANKSFSLKTSPNFGISTENNGVLLRFTEETHDFGHGDILVPIISSQFAFQYNLEDTGVDYEAVLADFAPNSLICRGMLPFINSSPLSLEASLTILAQNGIYMTYYCSPSLAEEDGFFGYISYKVSGTATNLTPSTITFAEIIVINEEGTDFFDNTIIGPLFANLTYKYFTTELITVI